MSRETRREALVNLVTNANMCDISDIVNQLENYKKSVHMDDDHTHDCLDTAIDSLCEIKFYDGSGNRY